jgi:[acyl-carrier-protein] S-malonyltransferase
VGFDGGALLTKVVALFPGQGSQKPGMARDLAAAFPAAQTALDTVDDALGFKLSTLMFDGPAEELTMTDNAQPALLAHSAAVWAVLSLQPVAAAGHSLGEFTAYHAAGALSLADAARLVRRRGELMRQATSGTMAAILGTLSSPIEEICAAAGGVVIPANYNAPDQIVISGEVDAVERAMAIAKEKGAKRAIRLPVSGAFHSPLMAPFTPGLAIALDEAEFATAHQPIYSNVDAQPSTAPDVARQKLLRQLTSPVRWVDSIKNLAKQYPDAVFLEIGTGTVLKGLVKRIAPEVETANCGTAAEAESLLSHLDLAARSQSSMRLIDMKIDPS